MRCGTCQSMLSDLPAGGPARGDLERHLAGCADCRRYYQALRAVEVDLRDAVPPLEPMPGELHRRIIETVRLEPRSPRRPTGFRRLLPVAAGLAAAIGIAVAVAVLAMRGRPHETERRQVVKPPPGRSIPFTTESLIDEPLAQVQQVAAAGLQDGLNRLSEEARTIGRVLLASLPVSPVAGSGAEWLDEQLDENRGQAPADRPRPTPSSRPL